MGFFFFFNFHKIQSIKSSFTENENKVYSGNCVVDRPWGALLPGRPTRAGWWKVESGLRDWPHRVDPPPLAQRLLLRVSWELWAHSGLRTPFGSLVHLTIEFGGTTSPTIQRKHGLLMKIGLNHLDLKFRAVNKGRTSGPRANWFSAPGRPYLNKAMNHFIHCPPSVLLSELQTGDPKAAVIN